MPKRSTYILTDHLCRTCGGRVLQQAHSGATAGGNSIYRCADCGATSCGMSPDGICWCGFQTRNNNNNPYRCLPFKGHGHLRIQFAACGHNPDSRLAEVGVILRKYWTPK